MRNAGGTLPVPPSAITRLTCVGRCRDLERSGLIPSYPHEVYPDEEGQFTAADRRECVEILRGLYTGELVPPRPQLYELPDGDQGLAR